MTEFVLSIDPGLSSAIALLSYEPGDTPTLEAVWQFDGGAEAMSDWVSKRQAEPHTGFFVETYFWIEPEDVICEAFTARSTKGFAYTTDSLEALPVIGALVARGLVDRKDKKRYRSPKDQYLTGGRGEDGSNKARQHAFLKESGYYVGRKEIGRTLKDYDDARSAVAHGLNYIAKVKKHRETYELIAEWVERNPV